MNMIHLVLRSNPILDQSSPDANGVFFHDCSVEVEPLAEHLIGQSLQLSVVVEEVRRVLDRHVVKDHLGSEE